MESLCLKEYRCECGKLLFKGFLTSAVVEIKCKRCGKMNLFQEDLPQGNLASFALKIGEAEQKKDDRLTS